MGKQTLSNTKKKELAKILFLDSPLTQKQIAEQVDVNENTITRWVKEEQWDELKTETNTTDTQEIALMRKQLRLLNEEGVKFLLDDDPNTKPDTDRIVKLTKSIHYLKTKTSVGQMYETGMEFLSFLQKEDAELAKQIAPLFLTFIKSKL